MSREALDCMQVVIANDYVLAVLANQPNHFMGISRFEKSEVGNTVTDDVTETRNGIAARSLQYFDRGARRRITSS